LRKIVKFSGHRLIVFSMTFGTNNRREEYEMVL